MHYAFPIVMVTDWDMWDSHPLNTPVATLGNSDRLTEEQPYPLGPRLQGGIALQVTGHS